MLSAPVVRVVRVLGALAACALVSVQALAIQPTNDTRAFKTSEGFVAADFDAQPSLVMIEAGKTAPPEMARFLGEQAGRWEIRWDTRNERPHLVQGSGIPLLPGAGNKLPRTSARKPDLAQVERLVRAFMGRYPEMFRIPQESLRLDTSRSISYGPDARVWFIELQQYQNGVPVDGANVFFRINNGNIVQFGADRIADVGISTDPSLTAAEARQRGLDTLGVESAEVSKVIEPGVLKIYPVLTQGEQSGEMYSGLAGFGYAHQLVWETTFRRAGDEGTYKMVVDAQTGALLGAWDQNRYATVQGGIYPTTNTDAEVLQPFAFATVSNGGTKQTDAGGVYSYSGGTATATLNGQFFQMSDACGSISLSNSTTGDLNFGTSGGTDCTTPGVGGAGNTHASRTGFYHLTKINRKAIAFLPGNSWLNSKVTANMNINLTCNAFWNGSTLNFYRSGGGCSNTGELAAVFLHEWGHGMDTNSGGSANEYGTGEAVGDTFAFIQTRDGCIGQNFQPGVNCANCTSCSGVRDVADFSVAGGATGTKIASPANVTANNGINCDRFSCPYLANGITPYQGPMGYEGHCESYIVSSANWDLAQSLVSTYGTEPGWSKMDQIWYGSLTPSKSGYRLVSGGKCNAAAAVDGCAATNWYTVYLPVDDDDGNLANGTPNACRIWDAFNAHGVACGTRPACSTGGPTPTPTNTPVPPTATPTPTSTPVGPTATPTNTPVPPTPTSTPTGVTVLTNGVPVSGVSGATGSQRFFSLTVPAGATNLRFTTTGGSDTDADLYVKFGSQPTTTVNDCKSETSTNNETCNIATATPGTWFVLVYGYSAYSGVTVTGSYTAAGPTPTPTATPSGAALTAVYNATLRAPACSSVGRSCTTGTLVNGRDGKGPEPNASNTIAASCTDGTSGTYHVDESNDVLTVSTLDGTPFAAGKTVRIDATVWAYSSFSSDKLDLYYAANANSPSWVFIGTLTPTGSGARTLSATYTLPAGNLQAVRAQFRYLGSASSCTSGGYNDRDDLVFAVQ
jgi:hypothetical protein